MLDRIEFLLGEGFAAFRRNRLMTLASVSTAAIALFVLGGMGYSYLKVRAYADSLTGRFTMRAFLKDGTDFEGIKATAAKIRAIPGVAEATWIPKEKAWEKEKKLHPDLTAGLDNPYPDAFKVRISDLKKADGVVAAIESLSMISSEEGVQYLQDEQQKLSQIIGFVRWLGSIVGGLALLTAAVLIYNTIRLTVVARRRELRVMQLVGASFSTIRIPFLIEGALQGLIGGIVAALLMYSAQVWLASRVLPSFSALGKLSAFPTWQAVAAMGVAGLVFGTVCAAAAVRDPLKLGESGS